MSSSVTHDEDGHPLCRDCGCYIHACACHAKEAKAALAAKKDALWAHFEKFIEDNGITCSETIYQTDWVIQNAYEFIEGGCDIVGYKKSDEE